MKKINRYLFLMFGFSIPIATSVTNILLGLILLVWIWDSAQNRFKYFKRVLTENPIAVTAGMIFLLYLVGMLYSIAEFDTIIESLRDGIKFLFVPMMMLYFREEEFSHFFLNGFIAAMVVVLFMSYMLWMGLLPQSIPVTGTPEDCTIFFKRITQNMFMAFTAFTFAVWAKFETDLKRKLLFGGLSIIALVNVFFLVQGRTGHVIMFLLMAYLVYTWRSKKSMIAAIVIITFMVGTVLVYPSNPLVLRAAKVIEEVKAWEYGKPAHFESSSGLRLEFYTNSLKLIQKNPVIGTGTGSFKKAYHEAYHKIKMNQVVNPHNDYLMFGVQFGLIGLLALLGLFALEWRCAGYLPDRKREILSRGFVLTMMFACMVSSPIIDHAEGWFFSFMTASLYSNLSLLNWKLLNRPWLLHQNS